MMKPHPPVADDILVRKGRATTGAERRTTLRYQTHDLSCSLGRVSDVSRTGAQVVSPDAPPVKEGQHVSIRIVAGGKKIVLSAEVVRIRRPKLMAKERLIGLRFVGTTRAHEQALENLGRFGTFMPGADQGVDGSSTGVSSTGATPPHDPTSTSVPSDACITMELPDLYAILDAPPDATQEQLRAAFRRLAAQLHPDVNPDPGAHERFQEVVQAWHILGDAELRKRFDERRGRAA